MVSIYKTPFLAPIPHIYANYFYRTLIQKVRNRQENIYFQHRWVRQISFNYGSQLKVDIQKRPRYLYSDSHNDYICHRSILVANGNFDRMQPFNYRSQSPRFAPQRPYLPLISVILMIYNFLLSNYDVQLQKQWKIYYFQS